MTHVADTLTLTGKHHKVGVQVVYTSYRLVTIPGQIDNDLMPHPRLEVRYGELDTSSRPFDFQTDQTTVGSVISVEVETAPDAGSTTLSLFVPEVSGNSRNGRVRVATLAVKSIVQTPLDPQASIGQARAYEGFELKGWLDFGAGA